MFFFLRSTPGIKITFATAWLFYCMTAQAGELPASSSDWLAGFSAGSIQSMQTAERALVEAEAEHGRIRERFELEEQACFNLFFANACRDAASERRRIAMSALRKVEIEANAFKRHARVAEREKLLQEKHAMQEAIDKYDFGVDDAVVEAAIPSTNTLARPSETIRDLQTELPTGSAATVPRDDRSRQIAAYERKVRESEARRREIEIRKAEKERKRQNKPPQ